MSVQIPHRGDGEAPRRANVPTGASDQARPGEKDPTLAEAVVAPISHSSAKPNNVSAGHAELATGKATENTWLRWQAEISALGGRSPLTHFLDTPRTRIELSATHPGGLPQFITGKATLLSSLIRDELALRNARLAAAEITQKGIELRSVRGIDAIHLAIGLASWRNNGREYHAPVLLRPLAIRRHGRDFELKLKGQPFLNPALARELRKQFKITLDGEAFVALAINNGVFKPQPVIDHLRGLTAQLPWFRVAPRLVVSSFAEVGAEMVADASRPGNTLIEALAGNVTALQRIKAVPELPVPVPQDERPPSTDTLLTDADPEQEQVIAAIQAGHSLVVKTLPGTGSTQTIVNAIGVLLENDKRVLVVGPRTASLESIAQRLSQVGLSGIGVTTKDIRRRLVQSIARNEKAARPKIADIDDALVRLRKVLLDYRGALTHRDPSFGVSALDALAALARLSLLDRPPQTTARLEPAALVALSSGRPTAAADLARAASLGEFKYGPSDSPWYGATFHSTEEASHAHGLAKRLNAIELPRLVERGRTLIAQTRMRQFESIAELGVFLRLLRDVRETLDKFQPTVFERPLGELIAATGARREADGMSSANRRRVRRLAAEYIRPGANVNDLNGALRAIQQQRTLWQRYSEAGAIPTAPSGLDDVFVAFQSVAHDLQALDSPLGFLGSPRQLAARPIRDLQITLAGLAEESEVLANMQYRTEVLHRLREYGLDPLLRDLSERHVPEHEVANELELAWWQSVLEQMLIYEKALLGANTSVLDRLEADFRLVDEAHASSTGPLLAWRLAQNWNVALVDHADEVAALKRLLRSESVRLEELAAEAPQLFRTLAPLWLSSPYDVHEIGDEITFDAVILVDAGSTTVAENLGAIRRAKQIVVFGDPVTQTPTPFEIGISDSEERAQPQIDVDSLHAGSVLARLKELLPTLTLTRSYRAGGEDLTELVNRRFYGGKIISMPWAGSFLGHGSLAVHYVKGSGLPDPVTGAVESTDTEVNKVIELVTEHAAKHPRESLMVITASARHAARVQQAVLNALANNSELSDFVTSDRPESFAVLTLDQAVAQSRDRVIFSIGYGRTPHGRLLTNFGPLGEPVGSRLLAVGMTRGRRSMDIVAAFRPDEIDRERQAHGVLALAEVLEQDTLQGRDPEHVQLEPMLVDLAARLQRRGIHANLAYRGAIALAASYHGRAVVVETDSAFMRMSLRESLRLRPELLRRLGWHYLRVHSFELFSDPDGIAARVAGVLGQHRPETPVSGSVVTGPAPSAQRGIGDDALDAADGQQKHPPGEEQQRTPGEEQQPTVQRPFVSGQQSTTEQQSLIPEQPGQAEQQPKMTAAEATAELEKYLAEQANSTEGPPRADGYAGPIFGEPVD